jgi:hypothetical protein
MSTVIEAMVFRFSFITFASLIALYSLTRMAIVFLRRLHQRIIDDRYLRGMRLQNYETVSQAPNNIMNNNAVVNNENNGINNVGPIEAEPVNQIVAQ